MSDINTTNNTNNINTTNNTGKRRGRPKLSEEEKLARKQAKESGSTTEKDYKDTRTDVSETSVTHISGDDFIRYYSNEIKGRNFIKRMLEEHPDECKPLLWDDGVCVEITLPLASLYYIRFPSKREMTEEEKEAMKERAKKMRDARLGKKNNNTEDNTEDNNTGNNEGD